MYKLLITGSSGFVASHFMDYIYSNHPEFEIVGISRRVPNYCDSKHYSGARTMFYELDLMDGEKLFDIIADIKPNYILHLASFSSVAYSWRYPGDSFTNNCNIFLNLIEAVKHIVPKCRIVSVGSSEEYGNIAHENLPIRENQPLNPLSPYAVARVSQELLSKVYVDAFGMQIIMTRSFNHIGPRQDTRFVIPSLIEKIIDIKKQGMVEGEIETGDLSIVRDFVDVRDVVDAYYRLLLDGTVGEVYNICTGKGILLSKIVSIIADEVGVKINTKTNPSLIRPRDNREIVGTPYKIETELGWERKWSIVDTIRDMIAYQEQKNE